MVSKVVITRKAQKQLSEFVGYIAKTFHDKQAAASVSKDARQTKERLLDVAESLQLCRAPDLAELGYRIIHFTSHRYLFIFEIRGDVAYIEATYHELQDYENTFKTEAHRN